MYPRTWFDTYWRGTLEPKVFVAMSFAEEFQPIWEKAVAPAIEKDLEGGKKYKAHRVDITTLSGSIVTEIFDGIAHATLVFADISIMTTGAWKGQRNGNVMYELGLATAVRPETDMIIVKSDDKEVSFDLLQIRVHKYPKHKIDEARQHFGNLLASALEARKNAKSMLAKHTWSLLDRDCLNMLCRYGNQKPFTNQEEKDVLTIRRLIELGIFRCEYTGGFTYKYVWTDFGKTVPGNPNCPTV